MGTRCVSRNRIWRLLTAILFALVAFFYGRGALGTVRGQNFDAATRFALSRGKRLFFGVDSVALDSISMGALIALTVVVLLIAVARRRWQLGARVALLVLGANLTTQVLKHWVLHRPDLGVDYVGLANSLPSGHSTVAMAAALGIVMVVPLPARTMAAFFGWVTASFVGIAVMLNEWHRLSDVLIAFLLVGIWGVALAPRERHFRTFGTLHRVTLVVSFLATLAGGIAMAFLWTRTPDSPLSESALRQMAQGNAGLLLALTSSALIVGLSGVILSIVNTQARAGVPGAS